MITPENIGAVAGGSSLWPRRLLHAAGGSAISIIALNLHEPLPMILSGIVAAGLLALDLMRIRISWLNRVFVLTLSWMMKSEEGQRINGVTYMFIGAFLSFLLFDKLTAVVVLFYLALGDPAAALVGRPMPGMRIFGKSPVGTLAFVGASLLVVASLVFLEITTFQWILVLGAVVGGLVELAPLPLDDNITIPLIAGGVIQFLPELTVLLSGI